ncbi:hypothetical protein HK100_003642 [Physocladia obscura]|uniref:F-box domain-containing protein n=1 Tax=Physocladia obscura TaxID=109957 RepID=A0AAD5SZU5_9FUNG|nr:hypothetical protein HK100_003642 [Physocladia obscura]
MSLPIEVLTLIIEYLWEGGETLGDVRRASRQVGAVAARVQWRNPRRILCAVSSQYQVQNQDYQQLQYQHQYNHQYSRIQCQLRAQALLARHANLVISLNLSDSHSLSNHHLPTQAIDDFGISFGGIFLTTLIPRLNSVTSMIFANATAAALSDSHFSLIAHHCPWLHSLVVFDCLCSDNALQFLADACTLDFSTLAFNRCYNISDAGLIPLVASSQNLISLSLCTVPLATSATVVAIATNCHKLELLSMSESEALNDDGLAQIARACPKLRHLDVSDCVALTEIGLDNFARNRKISHFSENALLKVLMLNGVEAVNDLNLLGLVTGELDGISNDILNTKAKLRVGLQTLELANIPNITHFSFKALNECLHTNSLTTLNLSCVSISIGEESVEKMSNALSTFFKSQQTLKHLSLAGGISGAVDSNVCSAIAKYESRLETLDLSDCVMVSDEAVHNIASSCLELVDANFKGCTKITDYALQGFLNHPSGCKLRFLNIGLCNQITDAATKHLALLPLTQPKSNLQITTVTGLHTLKFSGCFNVSDSSLDSLSNAISKTCASQVSFSSSSYSGSLRLLCFSGCNKLTTPSITRLTCLLPYLESINLYSCPGASNTAIAAIAAACPQIQSLVISKCPVGDIAAIAVARGCPRLHTLYMSFLITPPPAVVTDNCSPHAYLTDIGVRALLDGCKSLKLIDLSRSDFVSDAAFDTIGNNVDSELGLQMLILRACPFVSAEGMFRVLRRCRRLVMLDVLGCSGISGADREILNKLVAKNV